VRAKKFRPNTKPLVPAYKNNAVTVCAVVEKDLAHDGAAVARAYADASARTLTRPEVTAAAAIEHWQRDTHDVNALVTELNRQVEAVNNGDMRRAEAMLIAQAHTLDQIFMNLARRAVTQEYLKQWDTYMRMAMKAQSQCRMTLESLATLKNPQVVFARQANINNGGQQQVNNGVTNHPSRAGDPEGKKSELLEASNGERMDPGAQGTSGSADPVMEAVGALHRAKD
jgi:hypothetical protein